MSYINFPFYRGADSTIELVDVEMGKLLQAQDTRNSSIWTAGFDVACDIVFMTDRFHEVDGCPMDIQGKEPLAVG